jgi:peptide/nickel transport system permease protein
LNEPLPTQFVIYIANVLRGDLGTSIVLRRPALDVVVERIPLTLQLGIPALLISTLVGVPLGVIVARRRDTLLDRLVMSVTLAGQALPPFFIGILLILLFGVTLRWTPTFGSDTPCPPHPAHADAADLPAGDHRALDALLDAGGAHHRLRAHRARQRPL